jgi:uncharacterized protein (AIM24 family)
MDCFTYGEELLVQFLGEGPIVMEPTLHVLFSAKQELRWLASWERPSSLLMLVRA